MSLTLIIKSILDPIVGEIVKRLFNSFGSFLFRPIKRKKDIKNMLYFEFDEISNSEDFHEYIRTKGQEEKTYDYDEPLEAKNVLSFDLIDFFLKGALDPKSMKDGKKYRFLVLSGTGMGKSTFAVNLCREYMMKARYEKYPIFIYSCSRFDELHEDLSSYQNKDAYKSILILDGLDECESAQHNFIEFWKSFEKKASCYKCVIVTCRSQFFHNQEEEVIASQSSGAGIRRTHLEYKRYYISPFDDEDVKKYLKCRKYNPRSDEYQNAISFLNNHMNLMSRPMLLKFSDLNVSNGQIFHSSFELYKYLSDAWISRESGICEHPYEELTSAMVQISGNIYQEWKNRGRLYLSPERYQEVQCINDVFKEPVRSRSLLNRDSSGNIKFAHKSFWEFFLLYWAKNNPRVSIATQGADFAEKLSCEMPEDELVSYLPTMNFDTLSKNASDISICGAEDIKNAYDDDQMVHKTIYTQWENCIHLLEYWACCLNINLDDDEVSSIPDERKHFVELITWLQDTISMCESSSIWDLRNRYVDHAKMENSSSHHNKLQQTSSDIQRVITKSNTFYATPSIIKDYSLSQPHSEEYMLTPTIMTLLNSRSDISDNVDVILIGNTFESAIDKFKNMDFAKLDSRKRLYHILLQNKTVTALSEECYMLDKWYIENKIYRYCDILVDAFVENKQVHCIISNKTKPHDIEYFANVVKGTLTICS